MTVSSVSEPEYHRVLFFEVKIFLVANNYLSNTILEYTL